MRSLPNYLNRIGLKHAPLKADLSTLALVMAGHPVAAATAVTAAAIPPMVRQRPKKKKRKKKNSEPF